MFASSLMKAFVSADIIFLFAFAAALVAVLLWRLSADEKENGCASIDLLTSFLLAPASFRRLSKSASFWSRTFICFTKASPSE